MNELSMEPNSSPFTLVDRLCLMRFEGPENHINALTAWAEGEVMSGNDADTLLILASLGLDKKPDEDEVMLYLERYLAEVGISHPSMEFSALIWLRLQLYQLTHLDNSQAIAERLYFFVKTVLDLEPRFFSRSCHYLSWLYYQIFDDGWGDYPARSAEMTNKEIRAYIQQHLLPFERKLFNDDWLSFLAKT